MSPELSIIIVSYNSAAYLERCLLSIRKYLPGGGCEIIVVDNASSDSSPVMLRGEFPEVRLIVNPKNLGFASAMNLGLKASAAPFVLWLNPDTEFLDSSVHELIHYLKNHAETGVLGPAIMNPDGTAQLSCRSFPSYETALFSRYSLLTKLFPLNPVSRKYLGVDLDRSKIQETDWVSGACLLHRREILEKIGLLDEKFFMYCEDVDFCRRVKEAGWKIEYHPGMKVMHHIGGSSRPVRRRMIVEHHRSMWRYYAKHYRRNIFKDAIVAVAIFVRLTFKLVFP